MTTIVVDQEMGYMAADRRVTSNDGEVIMTCPTKIERVDIGGDKYLIGISGHEGPGYRFLDWFTDGDWDEPLDPMENLEDEHDFSVLMLSEHNGIELVDRFMRPYPIHVRWYGIGSGGLIAWSVLMAGCGIKKAMSTALEMDGGSGGGFEVVYLDDTVEVYE